MAGTHSLFGLSAPSQWKDLWPAHTLSLSLVSQLQANGRTYGRHTHSLSLWSLSSKPIEGPMAGTHSLFLVSQLQANGRTYGRHTLSLWSLSSKPMEGPMAGTHSLFGLSAPSHWKDLWPAHTLSLVSQLQANGRTYGRHTLSLWSLKTKPLEGPMAGTHSLFSLSAPSQLKDLRPAHTLSLVSQLQANGRTYGRHTLSLWSLSSKPMEGPMAGTHSLFGLSAPSHWKDLWPAHTLSLVSQLQANGRTYGRHTLSLWSLKTKPLEGLVAGTHSLFSHSAPCQARDKGRERL